MRSQWEAAAVNNTDVVTVTADVCGAEGLDQAG